MAEQEDIRPDRSTGYGFESHLQHFPHSPHSPHATWPSLANNHLTCAEKTAGKQIVFFKHRLWHNGSRIEYTSLSHVLEDQIFCQYALLYSLHYSNACWLVVQYLYIFRHSSVYVYSLFCYRFIPDKDCIHRIFVITKTMLTAAQPDSTI